MCSMHCTCVCTDISIDMYIDTMNLHCIFPALSFCLPYLVQTVSPNWSGRKRRRANTRIFARELPSLVLTSVDAQ